MRYDVQLGNAGGIALEVDVDPWQLEESVFTRLRDLIAIVRAFDDDDETPARDAGQHTETPPQKPEVGETRDDWRVKIVAYADECGSDAKAAKAFGVEDYRTIRGWRKEFTDA